MDWFYYYTTGDFFKVPVVKSNIRTGEGRAKPRPFSAHREASVTRKQWKNKKTQTKKSRRQNRR